jgi:hypothetical protein
MGTDYQALEQVDAHRLLDGLHNHPATGAHCLSALPQIFTDERFMLSL